MNQNRERVSYRSGELLCTKLLQGFYCETAAARVCIETGLSLQTTELQHRQQIISSAEGNGLYEMSGLKHKKAVMHKWEIKC